MVEQMSPYDQTFFKDTLGKLLKQVQSEWLGEDGCVDTGEISTLCSICWTPNRFIYYISNQYSGESINVGSECVKKFFDDITKKMSGGRKFSSVHRENVEQARKLRRLTDFFVVFPSADKRIDSWISALDELAFLLPTHLENRYKNCSYQANILIKEYQNRIREDETIFREFRTLIGTRDALWDQIIKYNSSRKTLFWAATREVKLWLIRNQKQKVLDLLRNEQNNSIIGAPTFADIWEPNYLTKTLPLLNEKLDKIGLSISHTDHEKNVFDLKHTAKLVIVLSYRIPNLLYVLRSRVVGSNKSDLSQLEHDQIIEQATITDPRSIEAVLSELNKIYWKFNIHLAYYHPEYDEVIFINSAAGTYKALSLKKFLAGNSRLVLNKVKPDAASIVNEFLKQSDRWYSAEKELDDQISERLGTRQKWYPTSSRNVVRIG
jgi:hypothetical protein